MKHKLLLFLIALLGNFILKKSFIFMTVQKDIHWFGLFRLFVCSQVLAMQFLTASQSQTQNIRRRNSNSCTVRPNFYNRCAIRQK